MSRANIRNQWSQHRRYVLPKYHKRETIVLLHVQAIVRLVSIADKNELNIHLLRDRNYKHEHYVAADSGLPSGTPTSAAPAPMLRPVAAWTGAYRDDIVA